MSNNLYNAIRVAHRSPTAILSLLVDSYSADYKTFAQGNNRAPLEEAIKILTGSKLDKTIALAISKGYDAGGLTTGYIGAVTGKYSAQPAEIRAKYDGAIEAATAAFRVALTDSGLFAEKGEKTDAEKQKAKAEREAKKEKETAEQKSAILNAAVVAGEVVRASDVNPITTYSDLALCDVVADRLGAGLFSEEAAENIAIDIGNKYPKTVVRVVDCMINLKQLDTVTMAILLESIHKNMKLSAFKNVLSSMGFVPVVTATATAEETPATATVTATATAEETPATATAKKATATAKKAAAKTVTVTAKKAAAKTVTVTAKKAAAKTVTVMA